MTSLLYLYTIFYLLVYFIMYIMCICQHSSAHRVHNQTMCRWRHNCQPQALSSHPGVDGLCSTATSWQAHWEHALGNSGEDWFGPINLKLPRILEPKENNLSFHECHCHNTWRIGWLKPVSHQGPTTLAVTSPLWTPLCLSVKCWWFSNTWWTSKSPPVLKCLCY